MTPSASTTLCGARILVVEDEPIIAFDLMRTLTAAGAEIVGPARTLAAAQDLAADGQFAAAILDVRLGAETVFPVAHVLASRKIPFAFHTAHAAGRNLAAEWPGTDIIVKPAGRGVVVATLTKLVQGSNSGT